MSQSQSSKLLLKLSRQLFTDAAEQSAFVEALTQPPTYLSAIAWCGDRPHPSPFEQAVPLPWQPSNVDRLQGNPKPGQHPLHDAGAFYCLDFSSVFAGVPLLTVQAELAMKIQQGDRPRPIVLDLCAAPGGKSVLAWTWLQPQWLLSNEVIGKRVGALISNLKRCHIQPAIALSADPSVLAEPLAAAADVVLVDAPCTGQSLLAKGLKAPGCFHPVNINKNANRQKRIVAHAAAMVAPQGYLLYMTCAYSVDENEQVCRWLLDRFSHLRSVTVPALKDYQSSLADFACYRMFPQSGLGAGAFTALFQNTADGQRRTSEIAALRPRWISPISEELRVSRSET
jgi:16S rRNA C967 or C1407 C5-methylase (RsmB/RsmF family)